MLLGTLAAVVLGWSAGAAAQDALPPPLPPDAPLADPVLRADAEMTGARAVTWREGSSNVVLLESVAAGSPVGFRMGGYGWHGRRMLARIDRIPQPGYVISHISMYIDGARPLGGSGTISAAAPRLLVTASTRGSVQLVADVLDRAPVRPANAFVDDGYARVARYRENLAGTRFASMPGDLELFPESVQQRRQAAREEVARRRISQAAGRLPRLESAPDPAQPPDPADSQKDAVLPTRGTLYITRDQFAYRPDEKAVMLIGNVKVVYDSPERQVALTAERMVILLRQESGAEGAPDASSEFGAADVAGVYLEDNAVITDGQYTVRAPRMFFDLEQNKAILLEAVMFTWDVRRQIPLYLRADVVKQESATSFTAENALLTTSEFAEPHFAIASDRVVLRRQPAEAGGQVDYYYATGAVPKWGNLPLFYFPALGGANRDIPLRRASAEFNDNNGFIVETTWDLFAIAGRPRPSGVDLLARVDYQGDHGPGLGLVAEYERKEYFGGLNSYYLPSDSGTDEIAQRLDIDHDSDSRGFIRWQHRQILDPQWQLSLEGAYVSDPTIVEEFFRDEAYEAKEYETSIYLKRQVDETAFTLLGKYDINDLTPQLTTLQAPGYGVDKLPEVGYYRTGTELWGDRLTYFTENRLGRMRIVPGDDSPEDRGFRTFQRNPFFGFPLGSPLGTSFADAYDALGYPLDWATRFDTRHELNMPMNAGIFELTPYLAGRLTAYDEAVAEWADEGEQTRVWGQAGIRAATEFSRAYDSVENRLFDVHRLRHIARPEVTVFGTGSSIDSRDLPFYDYDVEELSDASGVRVGMVNTLQTQRGGPGRWRSVDWITLRTDAVFVDEQHDLIDDNNPADDETGIARFFDYRPEFSTGGDHFYTQLLWLVTDTLGVTGELTHSFETDSIVEWRIGATMSHTPRLSSFVDVYEIDVFDSRRLVYGFNYQLTTKYAVRFSHRISLSDENADRYNIYLTRRLPRWLMQIVASYDEIDDETTVGLMIAPEGFGIRSPMLPLDSLFAR